MTTAAGEYIPLRLPPQFAALAVADPTPEPSFPLPPTSSTSPGRGGDVVTGDANAGGRRGVAAAADADSDVAPTRKAWRSPRRRLPDHGEVVFMEELGSAWPVPSRGVPSHKKKLPQSSPEVHLFLVGFDPFAGFVSRVCSVFPVRSLSLVTICS